MQSFKYLTVFTVIMDEKKDEKKIVRLIYQKSNYRVTAPKAFVEQLGWSAGDYIRVWVEDGKLCMEKLRE